MMTITLKVPDELAAQLPASEADREEYVLGALRGNLREREATAPITEPATEPTAQEISTLIRVLNEAEGAAARAVAALDRSNDILAENNRQLKAAREILASANAAAPSDSPASPILAEAA